MHSLWLLCRMQSAAQRQAKDRTAGRACQHLFRRITVYRMPSIIRTSESMALQHWHLVIRDGGVSKNQLDEKKWHKVKEKDRRREIIGRGMVGIMLCRLLHLPLHCFDSYYPLRHSTFFFFTFTSSCGNHLFAVRDTHALCVLALLFASTVNGLSLFRMLKRNKHSSCRPWMWKYFSIFTHLNTSSVPHTHTYTSAAVSGFAMDEKGYGETL